MTIPGASLQEVRWPRGAERAALLALALLAMALAWSRQWVCDDAFISLRYAEHFAAGEGLVYNRGERVEGYSNPTWVWLCALGIRLGLDPVAVAQWLGLLCYGALVPVTAWAGRRLVPGANGFLPLAAVAVALHRHLQDFATCGLETLGFVLLTTALVGVLAGAARPRDFALAGGLGVLAALTRPDGALLVGFAGLVALGHALRTRRLLPVLAAAAPACLLLVPFLAWRWLYYGDLLPNTFYAKSAHEPYAGQGWFYVRLYLDGYFVLWPAAVAAPLVLLAGRRLGALPLAAALALGYLGFVVWVGGDFMFARFCLPVTPLLYLLLEGLVRRCGAGRSQWVALGAVAAATVAFHDRAALHVIDQPLRGIADERSMYPPQRTARLREVGRQLAAVPSRDRLRVVFSGTQAMLVYESKVGYALEGVTGLTDRFLAHQPVGPRGHVGHEKGVFRSPATQDYAFTTQRVHLLLVDHPPLTDGRPYLRLSLFGMPATLVRWEPEVLRPLLQTPGVQGVDFDAYLDAYLADLDGKDPAAVRADAAAFELLHFRWNGDAARRQRLHDWLARH